MARDLTFTRQGQENVETHRVWGRHSRVARSLRGAAAKGGSADGAEVSDHLNPGGWSGWILDAPDPRTRRHRELRRRPGIDCNITPPPSGKDDRIDGEALVRALLAYNRGEPRVCAMLRVPTPEEEDRRRLVRERKALTNERIRHVNRIKGLLFSQGVSGYEPLRNDRRKCLDALVTGDGRPLPPALKAQISRELDRIELLIQQIKDVEDARDAMLIAADMPAPALLLSLKGIGPEFAAVLWSEGLSRKFDNRRQVAAYAGLAPTPWQSGQIDYEQGVSKSGNPRLRSTLVQVAWLWVRHQPNSALSQWFRNRVTQNGGRYKKTAIIALARKLLVAIWKYVTAGVVIEGAILTTPSA